MLHFWFPFLFHPIKILPHAQTIPLVIHWSL